MKYKFVRFKDKTTGEESKKWWFEANSVEQVLEHSKKFFIPTMQEGFDSASHDAIDAVFKYNGIMNHPTNNVARVLEHITEIKGYDCRSPFALFDTGNNLVSETVNNRINGIKKNGVVYLEDGVRQFGYTPNNKNFEIVATFTTDKFEYPDFIKPKIEDVRYIQWEGGWHWYAKINKEDIVDETGNQKWNTKKEAEEAAKWYISTYY